MNAARQPRPRLVTPADELAAALDAHDEVVLAGVAGVGKTTLVRQLLEDRDQILLLAPTAKAALRLTEVTGHAATTIHSVLYGAPREKWVGPDGICTGRKLPDGTRVSPPCRTRCDDCHCQQELVWPMPAEFEAGMLIVVDEASMVGHDLAHDLRSEVMGRGGQILWVGDPAQLPPVKRAAGVDLAHPHVELTTIHRSDRVGILQLSQQIRAAPDGEALTAALRHAVEQGLDGIVAGSPGWQGVAEWRAGAASRLLIVHRNRDRQRCNALVRQELGRTEALQRGDRILIRKNIRGFVHNGEVHVVDAAEALAVPPALVTKAPGATFHSVTAVLANTSRVFAVRSDLLGTVDNDAFERQRDLSRILAARITHGEQLVNAQYGFALTCHAAQGSEAPQVGVVWTWADVKAALRPDRFAYMRSWLYTAITRARQSLTIWVGP